MEIITESAFAKINLTLDVLGKRQDGYHDISSIMQTISLRDDVVINVDTDAPWAVHCYREVIEDPKAEQSEVRLETDGFPQDADNLAWRAAEAFFARTGKRTSGLEIFINKRIPTEAGLGGGSADAAAVLRALNRHFGVPLSIMALAELGAQVGSDVPFCVIGGTAMVEGRGERIRKLPAMPECIFVVVKPDFSVSTPELYRKLDETAIARRPDQNAMEAALLSGDIGRVANHLDNVFDPVVTADHLELNYIKSICNSYGSLGQLMTGSGSAVDAILPDFEFAAVVCNMLKESYPKHFIALPVEFY